MAREQRAVFAAGCFWGVEAAFRRVEGVLDTRVGYCGGTIARPTYEQVCTGETGHAEAVEVTFDPERVSYEELLESFFRLHDPTQVDRQGPDVGSQYRSAILIHRAQAGGEQERRARAALERERRSGRHRRPIATRIEVFDTFWPAEEYHQQYLAKRGRTACASTLRPR